MSCLNNFDLNALPCEDLSLDLNELPISEFEEDMGNVPNVNPHQPEGEVEEQLEDPIIDLTIDRDEEPEEHHLITRRVLSNEERQLVYNTLLEKSVNGKLKKSTVREVSSLLSVHIRTVQRIWKQGKDTPAGAVVDVHHRKAGNVGRKRIQADISGLSAIPLNQRQTVRSLAQALHLSYYTAYKLLQEGHVRRHTNALKPGLTIVNKRARLQFCLSMLDRVSVPLEPKFIGMYNTVHIDEKWFYMTKKTRNYYLLPQEEEPVRSCQNKNNIGKVMFLTAIARPRFDDAGNEVFSGKIGVFPLVTKQPALRRSRNREAGTLETKLITSVTKEVIRVFLLEKVIPAIQAKWPNEDSRSTIFIQQDNARTHVSPEDEGFRQAASQNGFDIRLLCQPPNSPDLNVLDLGFFSAIQSLQDKKCAKTVDELIHVVEEAFEEYPATMINRNFVTLQLCMREIMREHGANKYKIPHIGKARLEREGRLPTQIRCDYALVENVSNMLTD